MAPEACEGPQVVTVAASIPTTEKDPRDLKITPYVVLKFAVSTFLVFFCIAVIVRLILDENTKVAYDASPAISLVVIVLAMVWLFMVEGGQASLVGLAPVDRALYEESHPMTHQICSLGHRGNNLDRYLIGRQFLVLLIVFTTNQCGAALKDSEVFGLPDWFLDIFLGSGISMILVTSCCGQLMGQVNASHCMLDFIDTQFMNVTLWICLAVEASGVFHCAYLVQYGFALISNKRLDLKEDPRTWIQGFFFWGRVVMSLGILAGCLVVTVSAMVNGQSTAWQSIPSGICVIFFFLCMYIVGMLEGMQIAFFAVSKLTQSERDFSPMSNYSCNIIYQGNNLPNFMIGRQIFVTLNFFVIARLTTMDVDFNEGDETVFGVSKPLQAFFNTGLPGAIVTTILGSVGWQLVASAYPETFLGSPFCHILLRVCLFLENTGVCSAAWFFALIHKCLAGFQYDEHFIGTAEERKARKKAELMENARRRPASPQRKTPQTRTLSSLNQNNTTIDVMESSSGGDDNNLGN